MMNAYKKQQIIMGLLVMVGMVLALGLSSQEAKAQEEGGLVIYSKMIDGDIPGMDPMSPLWDDVPMAEFPMSAQVHWEPRIYVARVTSVQIKSLHNGEEMAILMTYKDTSNSPGDAAAVEFMVGDLKAHFAHGQEMAQVKGGPVNIWFLKNDNPQAVDMSAKGFKTIAPQKSQDVKAKGVWTDGEWRVVFSRAVGNADTHDAQMIVGEYRNVAFAIWDGANNERGAMKAVSSWWFMRLDPPTDQAIYVYTGIAVILVAFLEFVVIRRLRRKEGSA